MVKKSTSKVWVFMQDHFLLNWGGFSPIDKFQKHAIVDVNIICPILDYFALRPVFMAKQLISVLAFLKMSFFCLWVLLWKGHVSNGLSVLAIELWKHSKGGQSIGSHLTNSRSNTIWYGILYDGWWATLLSNKVLSLYLIARVEYFAWLD